MGINNKSRQAARLAAAGLCLAVGLAHLAGLRPEEPPAKLSPPPEYLALRRVDGGQALSPEGREAPDPLTRLNLGRLIVFAESGPEVLAVLPGLGPKSAVTAKARGFLTPSEQRKAAGYLATAEVEP